jgi:hypothetical protein
MYGGVTGKAGDRSPMSIWSFHESPRALRQRCQYEDNTRNAFAKEAAMAEEVRQVEHYSASIPNKVGKGARVLRALRDGGVNLIAFWVREQRTSSPWSGIARAASVLTPPHR